jgi:exopolysaccharide production protein ExoQ
MTPRLNTAMPQLGTLPLEDLVCAALFAFFAMQGSIPGIAPAQSLEMTSTAPTGLMTIGGIASQAIAYTLILALILSRPRLVLRQIAAIPWVALLTLLAVASTAWSLDPLLTLRRSLPLALAGLFGIYFAARFSSSRQLAILRYAMTALALATIAIVILLPAIGLDHSPGHAADWQGVFTQKNACGRIMVLATAVILFGGSRSLAKPTRLIALALYVFVLIRSGSRAAWMIEASLLLLWLLIAIGRRAGQRIRLVLAVTAPFATIALGAFLLLLLPRLALLLGRDHTLSGRTAIWAQVAHFITQRPLVGYGYDAFWRGMQGPSLQVAAAVHFVAVHAHNGFLEIALELGAAGLLLFVLSWLSAWLQLWPFWQRGEIDRIAWPLAILVLIALYDLDENTLLLYNGLFWILYVAAAATIGNAAKPPLSEFAQRASRTGDCHHTHIPIPREILSAVSSQAQSAAADSPLGSANVSPAPR